MTTPAIAALLAENALLRAIVDRVSALASGASQHWSSATADGTLAIVTTSGGWQDIPATERVYVRSDAYDEELAARGLAPREDGEWWKVGDGSTYPYSWGELNWLDDPACDRGTVSIETFVSVEALDAALSVEPAAAA